MGSSARWWTAAFVLALAAGVGVAWWRAPRSIDVPTEPAPSSGRSPGAPPPHVEPPMPAPPALARAAAPPGVDGARWAELQREFAARPEELSRIVGYLGFADAVQRFRAGDAAARRQLAPQIDAGLDERLRRREVSAGEARLLKIAVLDATLPDAASRQAALARWEADQAAAAPAVARDGEAEFLRRQAAVVQAWRSQPLAQRDPKALERELEALRLSSFPTADTGGTTR